MPDPKTKFRDDEVLIEQIQALKSEVDRLKKNLANKAKLVEQSAQPTLSVNGEFLFWRDTDDGKVYLIQRANDLDKKIELT